MTLFAPTLSSNFMNPQSFSTHPLATEPEMTASTFGLGWRLSDSEVDHQKQQDSISDLLTGWTSSTPDQPRDDQSVPGSLRSRLNNSSTSTSFHSPSMTLPHHITPVSYHNTSVPNHNTYLGGNRNRLSSRPVDDQRWSPIPLAANSSAGLNQYALPLNRNVPTNINGWMTSATGDTTTAVLPKPIGTKETSKPVLAVDSDKDSDEDDQCSQANKFVTVLETHRSKECCYKRHPTRSGVKMKQVTEKIFNSSTRQYEIRQKTIRFYQKDLIRYCVCGKYEDKSVLLEHGRNNDCKGYEIHYSQKCKWKSYTDFHTKETVLIRLCKCYKPQP